MRRLPQPVTNTDFYLAALVHELRLLNVKLDSIMTPPAQPGGETELREPEPKPKHRDAKRTARAKKGE